MFRRLKQNSFNSPGGFIVAGFKIYLMLCVFYLIFSLFKNVFPPLRELEYAIAKPKLVWAAEGFGLRGGSFQVGGKDIDPENYFNRRIATHLDQADVIAYIVLAEEDSSDEEVQHIRELLDIDAEDVEKAVENFYSDSYSLQFKFELSLLPFKAMSYRTVVISEAAWKTRLRKDCAAPIVFQILSDQLNQDYLRACKV